VICFRNTHDIEVRIRSIKMLMGHSRLTIALGLALLALAIGGHSIQAQQQVSGALASKAPEAAASSATAQANGHNSGTGSPGGSITLQ
jgi:hypothetical protein